MTRCACCDGPLGAGRIISPDRLHGLPGRFEVARCAICGTGRTLPFVGEEGLAALYPPDYAPHTYAERQQGPAALAARAIHRWQEARMLSAPALAPARRIAPGRALDVGCGRGALGAVLIGRGWQVDGVEPSPKAVEAARGRGVDARAGTLGSLAQESSAYDLVTFVHSLEHTVDPVDDLRRAAAAMRPGAMLAVTVPNFGSTQARLFGSRWFHLDVPRHRHHFTGAGLRTAIEAVGLSVERVATSTSASGFAGSLQYALAGRWVLREGLGLHLLDTATQATWPLARIFDLSARSGDLLHAVARRS
ncbi:MAG TPA: class I SAM-dependent methyltransferase [Thermoleophilaceae bacterium]|nr:class I SAM-dependent methyltransferase [Thermoleophilaceae bacterium]